MNKSVIPAAVIFTAIMTSSGVNPNVERLCFSGNRDTLLDSHLSTLGENNDFIDNEFDRHADAAIRGVNVNFRRSMSEFERAGCVGFNQANSTHYIYGEPLLLEWSVLLSNV